MTTLSVIIPVLNAAFHVPACCDALGEVDEVIVADGGSTDGTQTIAEQRGAAVISAARGRGAQLAAGAVAATSDWLLFLHVDTTLQPGWRAFADAFMDSPANAGRAAAFRFALDDPSPAARRLEYLVAWRCRVLALPYGDQGLLMSRGFYDAIGGYRPLPVMEDIDIVRRIGRRRLTMLPTLAVTSAERWQREGWWRHSARNFSCLVLYGAGVSPRLIARVYGA